jgi:hypothetical protein
MVNGLRRRFTYANFMATVAVFLALGGGGYAWAVSGSGRLQKAGVVGFTDTNKDVLALLKIGAIQASCSGAGGGGGATQVFIRNNSGKSLNVEGQQQAEQLVSADFTDISLSPLPSNNQPVRIAQGSAGDPFLHLMLQVSPTDGTSRPQADINITVSHDPSCSASKVTVLALNSEDS